MRFELVWAEFKNGEYEYSDEQKEYENREIADIVIRGIARLAGSTGKELVYWYKVTD